MTDDPRLGSQNRPPVEHLREVLEAVRALGWTRDEAHRIVDDVFGSTIVNFDDEAQAEVTLGSGERPGPDAGVEREVAGTMEGLPRDLRRAYVVSSGNWQKVARVAESALASRSAPDGWVLVEQIIAREFAHLTADQSLAGPVIIARIRDAAKALAASPSALSGEGVDNG